MHSSVIFSFFWYNQEKCFSGNFLSFPGKLVSKSKKLNENGEEINCSIPFKKEEKQELSLKTSTILNVTLY